MSNTTDDSWAKLRAQLNRDEKKQRNRDIAFILGAGVSYDSRLPTWEKLVSEITENPLTPPKIDKACLYKLRERGWTWPSIASLARYPHNENNQEWIELVREKLYAGFNKYAREHNISSYPNDVVKEPNRVFREFMEDTNPSLTSVVQLCATEVGHGCWSPRLRVAAFLTYNFDALIQMYDRARHGTPRILRTIERASKERWTGKTPLYHLHGYLHPTETDTNKEGADVLVFCENEYHRRTDEPFNFASTAIMWALRECVCVFVGCSMTDELMRRSLYRAKCELQEAKRHESGKDGPYPDWEPTHFAVMQQERLSDGSDSPLNEFVRADLKLLGVEPLGVDNFKEDIKSRMETLGKWLDVSQ